MSEMSVRDARTHLSAVIRAAQNGEPTTLTRNGREVAMIVPIERALALYPELERELSELASPKRLPTD